jgi:hypothetical protein
LLVGFYGTVEKSGGRQEATNSPAASPEVTGYVEFLKGGVAFSDESFPGQLANTITGIRKVLQAIRRVVVVWERV